MTCCARSHTFATSWASFALDVHSHAFFVGSVLGQVDREAVGVVEFEGAGAVDDCAALGLDVCDRFSNDLHAILQRLEETLFLVADDRFDKALVLDDLRISLAHLLANLGDKFVEEWLVQPDRLAQTHSTAQNATQHVTTALVARKHAVGDEEGASTGVVSDDTERKTAFILMVFLAG